METAEETCEMCEPRRRLGHVGSNRALRGSEHSRAGRAQGRILSWHSWQHARSYTCSSPQQRVALHSKRQLQTEGWTRAASGPNFLKDQTRCWQPLQGLQDGETPYIVTQDIPRTPAHSGPHLPGLVTPLLSPGSSTASMAPSRRSRITVAGGGYQVGAVGVQGTGRKREALTLQLSEVFQLQVQPWGGKSAHAQTYLLPAPLAVLRSQDAGVEGRTPQKRAGPETHAVPIGQEAAA